MTPQDQLSTFLFRASAIVVGVVALFVAVLHIPNGLPFLVDPDEPAFIDRAVRIATTRDLNPHWFGHPGSVTIYLMSVAFAVYGRMGIWAGWFTSMTDVAGAFDWDPTVFYAIGRATIATSYLASLGAFFLLARVAMRRWFALVATAALAIAPTFADYSALIRSDVQQTIFVLLATLFSVRIARRGALVDYVLAGVAIGLGSATKYPTVTIAVVVCAAMLIQIWAVPADWKRHLGLLFIAGTCSVVALFLASPFMFLDMGTVLRDVLEESDDYHLSATSSGFLSALWFYVAGPLSDLTPLAAPLAALGLVRVIAAMDRSLWLLILAPLVYLAFISALDLRWVRWAIPLIPFVALLSLMGVEFVYDFSVRFLPRPAVTAAVALAAVGWLSWPIAETLSGTRSSLETVNLHQEALDWVRQTVPRGSRILVERYTAQLAAGEYEVFHVEGGEIRPLTTRSQRLVPDGVVGNLVDVSQLTDRAIQYVILGTDYARRAREPDQQAEALKTYARIFAAAENLGTGPLQITIYRVDKK